MGFVAPLVLMGLGALAIPVLIHLIQRERKRVVEFPSLMFLRKIPYQSVRRRRIRDWFLLLMRLTALALIVLAFARPFFKRSDLAAAAQSGAREAIILVDTSYSMEYGDRWQKAKSAATDAIRGLGPGDRASLVFFSSGAEVAVRSGADRGRLEAGLAAAATGPGATRFAPALKLASSLLGESALPRREIILISDFQRRGWEQTPGRDDVKLPERTTLTPVNVAAGETSNLSATPVSLQRTRFENHDRVVVTAGVVNHGKTPVKGVTLALEIDGNAVQSLPTDVAPGGSSSVTFGPVTVASRNMRGTVRLPDDALKRDNVFHFVVSPTEPVQALVINRSGERESLYISRALAIGESPRIEITTRTPANVSDADLRLASVVVVNDIQVPDDLAGRLSRFVAAGGGLFIAAGPNATWPESAADTVPGLPGDPVDRTMTTPSRVGGLEYSHPVFELFRAPRTGDYSAARFYGYRGVQKPTGQVLARFDDGTPALMESRSKPGAGRVLLWTSTLDLTWNDLAVKPVFLPFIHTVTKYLANFTEAPPSLTVGQVIPAPRRTAGKGAAVARGGTIAVAPSGARVAVETEDGALELTEQGFYDVRTQGAAADSATTLASNVDLSESDLAALDPKELAAAVAGRSVSGAIGGLANGRPSDEAQAQAQRLWWYLLVAGGLLLAAETMISNRLSQNGARVS
jgi:hypothetical protein